MKGYNSISIQSELEISQKPRTLELRFLEREWQKFRLMFRLSCVT